MFWRSLVGATEQLELLTKTGNGDSFEVLHGAIHLQTHFRALESPATSAETRSFGIDGGLGSELHPAQENWLPKHLS